MSQNFSLLDKIVDINKFNFEEATLIALSENWNSYFGLGFDWEKWNEAFYLIVFGSTVTSTEFKEYGKINRIFNPLDVNNLSPEDEQNKKFCIELQRKLAKENIKRILSFHTYKKLLMLGVALKYVEEVEKYNKILTTHWTPKFCKAFALRNGKIKQDVKTYYENLLDDQRRYLTYNDLDVMNHPSWFNDTRFP